MIAVLRIPGRGAEPYRVELPTAPIPDDIVEVDGTPWRVTDRKFVVPRTGESEVVLSVEAVDGITKPANLPVCGEVA